MNSKEIFSYQAATFKKGSATYFNSSLFFPRAVRSRVFALYAFVRRADDFVDATPQDAAGFQAFRDYYRSRRDAPMAPSDAAPGFSRLSPEDRAVVDAFIGLEAERRFESEWTEAFLASMAMDLEKREYDTLDETLRYIYGSAEVIGLFMARVMDLPEASYESAKLLGRSMQYINFIRDIAEDRTLGRRYLPLDGAQSDITDPRVAAEKSEEFSAWLRAHLDKYRQWQSGAVAGFSFIPYRCRIAVATAASSYWWTARQIEKNPLVVFDHKVKPSPRRIAATVLLKALTGARL
ncbi:MAG: phytoene/squalene synthase family protein [Treponemataceae bacterium]